MRELQVVLGLLQQGDEYLLQLRQGDPATGSVGQIGTFGGKLEPGETELEAVCRELSEETSYSSKTDNWKRLGNIAVESDYKLETTLIKATAFQANVAQDIDIHAKEGQLVRINKADIHARLNELTPATKALFKELL